MTNDEYFNELVSSFPSLNDKLDEEHSLVHFKMERFAEYTIDQIVSNEIAELNNCFAFQEARIDLMSHELTNALNVSYCEALLLGSSADRMDEIVAIMPPKLLNAYMEYKIYYYKLLEENRRNS